MRLADFILRNMETILGEWEEFAATLLPAAGDMTTLALRDHAKEILEAVAKDLSTPQTEEAQAEKIQGLGTQTDGRARDSRTNARRAAGAKRLRHQPTGR